jgi:hypothetical protein
MTNTKLFQEMQDALYPEPPEITDEVLIERALQQLLESSPDEEAEALWDSIRRVSTFEDDMVMTSNRGVVIKFSNGSEFQVTIVRSR